MNAILNEGAARSFLRGYVSVFDVVGGGIEVPDVSRGFEKDTEVLAEDWNRVGQDLKWAMDQVAADEQ